MSSENSKWNRLFNRPKPVSEVEYLRGLVKDLTDRLMALTGDGYQRYRAEKRVDAEIEKPTVSTEQAVVDKINGMEAKTDKDKAEKAAAIDFVNSIIGGGSHA